MKNQISFLAILFAVSNAHGQSDSTQFYFNKGLEEKKASHWLQASKHFNKAIKFDAKFTNAWLEDGLVNLEMRKTDQAKADFTKVYELEPGNAIATRELMELSFNYRQWAKALEFAQKCSSCPNAPRITALSYYQLEDYGKAEKLLLQVLNSNPADAVLNYSLAKTYIEMEAYPKAAPYFQKAIDLDTSRVNWMVELGDEFYEAQRFKDAVKYYNMAINHGYTPNNDFLTDLGFSYIYSMEYKKGEDMIKGVYDKNPGKKDLLSDVADAFYDRKMYDKALEYCQKLLELDMKDTKALYKAGLCFQKKGEKDRGQAMCDKAIEMDPSLASLKKQQSFGAGL
jgi:tetratricopeptide (TPR) repeat protein